MRKTTCAGWKQYPEWTHVIEKNSNGDAIGCRLVDGSQSWNCLGCQFKDAGEEVA